jgi:tRNA nucleotidyltransferase/poly(A) polymerase
LAPARNSSAGQRIQEQRAERGRAAIGERKQLKESIDFERIRGEFQKMIEKQLQDRGLQ